MVKKVRRVRRRKRIRSLTGLESFSIFRHHLSPARLALLIGATALAFILGAVFFSYGSKLYIGWREASLLKRGSVMLRQENFKQAAQIAREVLQLHPDSLPAFHILAEAAEKRNLEEAVFWRAQIARLLPHDMDSQLNWASAALRFDQLDIARKALNQVPSNDRDRAAFHVVAGWLARAEGNFTEQEQQFAAALKKEPDNELYQFNLAALQIRSPDQEKSAKARAMLEQLSKLAPFRTGALRALLNDAVERNDLSAADTLAQQLQMSQQVTFADYLLCLNFYRKLDQEKLSALLEKVKPVAARNSSDLALLIDWMNSNGLAVDVVKWIDKFPSEIVTHPPVAITVAEAFAELKNWSRLKRWTRARSWEDADYLRLAYQAFAARQSRQSIADAEFDKLWRSAERAANEQPNREVKLARLATKWNLSAEADQLWSRLSRNPPSRREALDALYRAYRANNEIRKLYDVLQRLHESSPNEVAITANLARLGLNIEQNTKQAQDLAKEAYDRAPNDVNCGVTYAFSLYGLGRSREGLDIIRKLPTDQLYDPHAAVYVALLLLDENQMDAAREYIEAAERGPIYLEEKRLLDDAMAKMAGTPPSPAPTPSAPPTSTPRSTSRPRQTVSPAPAATSPVGE
jgi:predicted Zn-dependent protease